ncbi:MAG TPA: energy transducer TonB [Terriglobales bacterium]
MFEDSLVESSGALSRKNPWTASLSFAIQAFLAGVLVLLPLIYTQALPWRQITAIVNAPVPPPQAAPPSSNRLQHTPQPRTMIDDGVIRLPSSIPRRVAILHDEETTSGESGALDWAGVPGGTGTGVPNSLLNNLVQVPTVMPKVVAPSKIRVSSGVAQGLLVHQVKPAYPPLAVQARIQGTVVLQAVIAKDGTVQDLRVISGHPLLVQAALEAVKLWRYKPYLLNDQPVEVDTQINVSFTMAGH